MGRLDLLPREEFTTLARARERFLDPGRFGQGFVPQVSFTPEEAQQMESFRGPIADFLSLQTSLEKQRQKRAEQERAVVQRRGIAASEPLFARREAAIRELSGFIGNLDQLPVSFSGDFLSGRFDPTGAGQRLSDLGFRPEVEEITKGAGETGIQVEGDPLRFQRARLVDPVLNLELGSMDRLAAGEEQRLSAQERRRASGGLISSVVVPALAGLGGALTGGALGAIAAPVLTSVATPQLTQGPLTFGKGAIGFGGGALTGLSAGTFSPPAAGAAAPGLAAKVGAGTALAAPVVKRSAPEGTFQAQAGEGRKMGLLDDLGRAGIGAIGGGFSGGVGGALAGGLAGGLLNRGQGLNLGTGIESGLLGLGAGQIGGKLQRGLGTFGQPGIRTQPIIPGQEAAGPGVFGRIGQFGKDVFGGLKGGLGGVSQGLGAIRGIFGGGGGPGQPQGAPTGTSGAGTGAPGGFPGGIPRAGGLGGLSGQDLSLLAGLGLFGAGLAQGGTEADLQGIFAGAPEQTRGLIDAQIAAEAARRQAAEEQFLGRRGEARGRLEDILGQGSEQAFGRAIQSRQEQLNRQGLLSGPSGALDFALAQEAANLRRSQLPALLAFEQETEGGLGSLRGAGLEGALGLQRAGLERQFGLGDQLRSARLIEQLREAESNRSRQNALLRAAGQLGGFGLGLPGQQGGGILEGIFGS